MEIKYIEQEKTFMLSNGRISYAFSVEKNRYLMHGYFGRNIQNYRGISRPYFYDRGFCSNPIPEERTFSLDTLPQEYPDMNQGDFRSPAYVIQTEDGRRVTRFYYKNYRIIRGKPILPGLPSVYTEDDEEALTLCVELEDKTMNAGIELYYTIFRDYDAVCRHVEVINAGKQELYLERLMSMSMDFPGTGYDVLTMTGGHMNEKNLNRRPVSSDSVVAESIRGCSSPQATPGIVLMEKEAGEHSGEVWGFQFVYSGDFQAVVQAGQFKSTRVQMGMNPLTFGWNLKSGERFVCPETVLVYSGQGLNGMSHTYHSLYRKRLCRGIYRDKERPVLLNSWEAFEFHVNEEKCRTLAGEAAKLGIELFVVDDGWFKNRVDDKRALGDWTWDREKFPGGISRLAKDIRSMGMDFGIWFEPEMVSPDSDLYRSHPDWIIRSPDYEPVLSRYQYVLDLSNPEVCEYVIHSVAGLLEAADISYVKWDMNRHMTDLGSFYLDGKQQRELSHRYMLGLYYILDTLNRKFPEVLFEGCSSGGGRYDAGMLYYMPQTWASDNSDAICRMKIQYGTSLFFPPVTMGAHVSVSPNLQVGRETPLAARFTIAMSGNLGYEMDFRILPEKEKETVKEQIAFYKEVREVIQKGKFYRLINPQTGNVAAWNFVSEDEQTVIYCYAQILSEAVQVNTPVKLKGLRENWNYRFLQDGSCYGGDELMYAGITAEPVKKDFISHVYIFKKEGENRK